MTAPASGLYQRSVHPPEPVPVFHHHGGHFRISQQATGLDAPFTPEASRGQSHTGAPTRPAGAARNTRWAVTVLADRSPAR
jgi:hypothetical protein